MVNSGDTRLSDSGGMELFFDGGGKEGELKFFK